MGIWWRRFQRIRRAFAALSRESPLFTRSTRDESNWRNDVEGALTQIASAWSATTGRAAHRCPTLNRQTNHPKATEFCGFLNRPQNGKKRRLAAKPSPPCRFKALIRRGSRLAVMHANNDPLGVRSASVSGPDAEGRPFVSLPGRLSSSGRALIVDSFIEVSRGTKRVSCGFHVDNVRFTRKADIVECDRHVRFVPKADSCTASINAKRQNRPPVSSCTANGSSPMSVMRTRTVPARIAPNITTMLRNKEHDGFANFRANKNRPYVQTDIRRLRRTTRFEHNDRNDVQTRSCPRKRD